MPTSASDWENTASTDVGLEINFSKQANSQIRNRQITWIDYIVYKVCVYVYKPLIYTYIYINMYIYGLLWVGRNMLRL